MKNRFQAFAFTNATCTATDRPEKPLQHAVDLLSLAGDDDDAEEEEAARRGGSLSEQTVK